MAGKGNGYDFEKDMKDNNDYDGQRNLSKPEMQSDSSRSDCSPSGDITKMTTPVVSGESTKGKYLSER